VFDTAQSGLSVGTGCLFEDCLLSSKNSISQGFLSNLSQSNLRLIAGPLIGLLPYWGDTIYFYGQPNS
jgi:hypothetical protein